MKISDFKRNLVAHYKSGLCIHLRGRIGIGKSTVIEGAPEVLEKALGGRFGLMVRTAVTMNPNDAVGYNMPWEKGDRLLSRFTEPEWFVTEEGKELSEYGGGVIFIDEMDKADVDVKKIMGEMCLSGRLGPHRIPKGWVVWTAGNDKSDMSGSTKEFKHLINRRKEIELEFNLTDFEDYCLEVGVHPLFIHFASQNSHMFTASLPKEDVPFITPRSLVRCAFDVMSRQSDPERVEIDPVLNEEIAGMIGDAAAAALGASVMLQNEMPRFQDIVSQPMKAKLPDRADAQILVVYNLAARVDEKTMEPVIDYVGRLPAEFTIAFGKAAVRRQPALVNTAAFGKWCVKNHALMMAITSV